MSRPYNFHGLPYDAQRKIRQSEFDLRRARAAAGSAANLRAENERLNDALLAAAKREERYRVGVVKIRDGYVSQMKFCDIEPLPYFREFVRRLDALIAEIDTMEEGR
jgi:hypothetical protein